MGDDEKRVSVSRRMEGQSEGHDEDDVGLLVHRLRKSIFPTPHDSESTPSAEEGDHDRDIISMDTREGSD
jgi:hypothetical protein